MTAQIGIVLGSYSDVKRIAPGLEQLKKLKVPFQMTIASAHRTPERLVEWLKNAEKSGTKVIVAGAGASAHLPGVVASKTVLPVVGLPFDASPLEGTDALFSIVQMPPGIPVATVGIDAAVNAVLMAMHILAIADEGIRRKLQDYRSGWQDKIEKQNTDLYEAYPEARPSWDEKKKPLTEAPPRRGDVPERKTDRVRNLDREAPDVEIIEQAVAVLREGGVVAIPTDTVYGLAADATNSMAVEKLYRLKGREERKPIPVLVDSMRLFRAVVRELPEGLDGILDAYWPGPLTVVVDKAPDMLPVISKEETIAIRMPDSFVGLGLISMFERPLATTSANLAGHKPAMSGAEVAEMFGGDVDLILDGGVLPPCEASSVLDATAKPYKLLREGALSKEDLRKVLGEDLE
ncbi:MAG: 5-(carboxyamino)imidazole ribonucleotide mutase [Candidatus Sumerlaeota bacterium]